MTPQSGTGQDLGELYPFANVAEQGRTGQKERQNIFGCDKNKLYFDKNINTINSLKIFDVFLKGIKLF